MGGECDINVTLVRGESELNETHVRGECDTIVTRVRGLLAYLLRAVIPQQHLVAAEGSHGACGHAVAAMAGQVEHAAELAVGRGVLEGLEHARPEVEVGGHVLQPVLELVHGGLELTHHSGAVVLAILD
jgi:hypothetical protein